MPKDNEIKQRLEELFSGQKSVTPMPNLPESQGAAPLDEKPSVMAHALSTTSTSAVGQLSKTATANASEVLEMFQQVRLDQSLYEIYKQIVTLIKEVCNLYHVQIYETLAEKSLTRLAAGCGKIGDFQVSSGITYALGEGLVGSAVQNGVAIIRSDLRNVAGWDPDPLLPETVAEAAFPLKTSEKIIGVVEIFSKFPGQINSEMQGSLEIICSQIAIAVLNHQLLFDARISEKRFQDIAMSGNDWIWEIDANQNFMYSSEQVFDLLGYSPKELIGKKILDIVAPSDVDELSGRLAELFKQQSKIIDFKFRFQTAQDNLLTLELNAVPIKDEAGSLVGYRGAAKDITVQVNTEYMLNKRIRELKCLGDIGHKIDEKPVLSDFLAWITERIPEAMQYPNICKVAITYLDQVFGSPEAVDLPRKMVGGIRIENDLVGYLHIAYTREEYFLDEESAFIGNVVERISNYIVAAQTEAVLRKQARDLRTVSQISTLVASVQSVDELLRTFVYETRKQFDLYHAHVFVLSNKEQKLRIHSCGWEENSPYTGTRDTQVIHLGQEQSESTAPIVSRAARLRQPVLVNDIKEEPSWQPNPLHPLTGSELAVPLIVGDQLLGILDVQAIEKGHFSPSDITVTSALATQIAVALQNAHRFEQSTDAIHQAETLYTGSAHIVRSTTTQELLHAIVESTSLDRFDQTLFIAFDKPWVDTPPSVYRIDAVWPTGEQVIGLGTGLIQIGAVLITEQFPLAEFASNSKHVFIFDTATDDRLSPDTNKFFQELAANTLISFPLTIGEQCLGVIIGLSAAPNILTDDEIRQLESLTSQAAAVFQAQQLRSSLSNRLQEMIELQRQITRTVWSEYLVSQEHTDWGYIYDRVDVHALHSEQYAGITSQGRVGVSTVPVTVSGSRLGLMGLRELANQSITSEEETFLDAIASQVAQALERTRLIEQTQQSALQLQTVAQVSTASATILNPTKLLEAVVDLAKKSFNLYHAHVYLTNEAHTHLVLAAGAGEVGQKMVADGWAIRLDANSIVAHAARTGQSQVVNNVREDPNYYSNPLLPHTASELAMPMIVGANLLGVLDVQSDRPNRFTKDDQTIFSTLTAQTAIALQNARLFEEQSATVEKLRELDNLKSAFLANMSHELRTPLNSILGFTQVILEEIDGPLTEYMIADLKLIEKNGHHLLTLINEVLDMAKIESGRLTLTPEKFDFHTLVSEVIETIASQARDKSLYLRLEDHPAEDINVYADPMRMRQVMINVIGNGIKFTEAGGITIRMQRNADILHVEVSDTGIGVTPDKLDMIFEAFSQVDTSTTRKAGGTGLGLPISRRLVEMHGGKLWAESTGQKGSGTTFHLNIPMVVVSTPLPR